MSALSPCISSCSDPSSCLSVLHSSFRAPMRARGSRRRPADRSAGAAGDVGCRCAAGWRAAPWRARWCGGGAGAHAHPRCWCGGAAAGGGASLLGLGWDCDSSGRPDGESSRGRLEAERGDDVGRMAQATKDVRESWVTSCWAASCWAVWIWPD
jgi:hypothetical protein